MCGIFGYVGNKNCIPYIISGLEKLEYRGYDSAGIAYLKDKNLEIKKIVGKVQNLKEILDFNDFSNTGIGHTRWATHGGISVENAHPHTDCEGNIAVVHNGIIENYKEIKNFLISRGHKFRSQTDTEIVPHLLEEMVDKDGMSLEEALKELFKRLEGAFALLIIDKRRPSILYALRKQSPLIVGFGTGENFVASDIPALGDYTERFYYLKDNQMAIVSDKEIKVYDLKTNNYIEVEPIIVPQDGIRAEKNGYPHFMLKEIFEQPLVVRRILSTLDRDKDKFIFEDIKNVDISWEKIRKVFIVACGTSYHAGYYAKFLWEKELPYFIEVELASQMHHRNLNIPEETLFITISQSGETADVISTLRKVKENGFKVLSLVNNPQSTVARESDYFINLRAGVEIGVAATKTFMAELVYLELLKEYIKSRLYNIKIDLDKWNMLPTYLESYLSQIKDRVFEVAKKYYQKRNFLYLARGKNFPLALEGALKLKEISYIHAEGIPAGEMKHGPIALLDPETPVFGIVYKDETYSKMINNLEEAKARKAPIIAIGNEWDEKLESLVDDLIPVPNVDPFYYPYMGAMVLQLFAYHVANLLGREIDQPRNLAKSVTVE
ncbi:MAG: glutamine--fructose-6-phosphate transaminase (isomerizing) [Dictyoglomus thermophilum]